MEKFKLNFSSINRQEYVSQEGTATRTGVIDERDAVFQQIKHLHVAEAINWLVANRNKFTGETESASSAASAKAMDINDIAKKLKTESRNRDILTKVRPNFEFLPFHSTFL